VLSIEERLTTLESKRSNSILRPDEIILRDKLKSSLLEFTKYFYPLRKRQQYVDWPGQCRASMLSQIIPELEGTLNTDIDKLSDYLRIYIGCAPRYGKTEISLHYIAWALANYPDSFFMYVSYAAELSREHTKIVRSIVSIPEYGRLFGVYLDPDLRKANHFAVNTGGEVYGVGAGGPITGKGAGIQGIDRFGGAIIIDDIHKPNEACSSAASRDKVSDWYKNTLSSRVNDPKRTPIIFIGQRVHQDDQPGKLLSYDDEGNPYDEYKWKPVIIPTIDTAGNPIRPDQHDKEACLKKMKAMPYVWASQYQQNPTDDANALFKVDDFPVLDVMPNIEITFITVDTACQANEWNDYTVFSMFGLYKQKISDYETEEYALHCLKVDQKRIEPENIENELDSFILSCMNFKVKPRIVIIELAGVAYSISGNLRRKPGLIVLDIQRSGNKTSKIQRFIDMQPHVKRRKITFQSGSLHNRMVIEHMCKITPSESHAHDDVADTLQMACEKCFDQELIQNYLVEERKEPISLSTMLPTSTW
jgi:hypothetical protein